MIDLLDMLLFRLFRWQVAELTGDAQVRFQPPDEDWRAMVPNIADGSGNPANSLNVYLVDLRENRRLRTNERARTTVGQDVYETPPPRRVDCHYLISAWSPVQPSPGIDPTPDEHALLAEVARVLGAATSSIPRRSAQLRARPAFPRSPCPRRSWASSFPSPSCRSRDSRSTRNSGERWATSIAGSRACTR